MPTSRVVLAALLALAVAGTSCTGSSVDTTVPALSIPASLPPPPSTTTMPAPESTCLLAVGGPAGAEVLAVVNGSPAAGVLRLGDVIVAVDGEDTQTADSVVALLQELGIGATASLTVERDGAADAIDLTLTENPSQPGVAMMGATIKTVQVQRPLADVPPAGRDAGPLSRVMDVDGSLLVLDGSSWEAIGAETPTGRGGWTALGGDILVLEQGDDATQPGTLVGLLSGTTVELDIADWSARRVLGPFGRLALFAAQRPTAQEEGLEQALIAVDPASGQLVWQWEPAAEPLEPPFEVPVPIETFADPSGEAVVVVVFFPGIGAVASVIVDGEGNAITTWPPPQSGFLPDGSFPRGWFDDIRLAYIGPGEETAVFLEDVGTNEAEQLEIGLDGVDGLWPVGDGEAMLVRDSDGLSLVNVDPLVEPITLASGCTVGPPSARGWGLAEDGLDS